MPLHALELLPYQGGQQVIRRDWRVLSEAGLRSQLEHRGATNAPHLTLVAAAAIGPPKPMKKETQPERNAASGP